MVFLLNTFGRLNIENVIRLFHKNENNSNERFIIVLYSKKFELIVIGC